MSDNAQKRALENYRRRLSEQGLARFEVLALDTDRDLIRALAKRLAANDTNAAHLRADLRRNVADAPVKRGGVLAALRASPMVGADIDLSRERTTGRRVDL